MSVLDRLKSLLTTDSGPQEPKPLPPTDVPHLIGALLVRVAKADANYAVQEISQIDRILARMQDIGPVDAARLRGESERLEAFAPDTHDFADKLRKNVSYDDRLAATRALWDVVFADGATHEAELETLALTQAHLGISAEDCAAARADARAAGPTPSQNA